MKIIAIIVIIIIIIIIDSYLTFSRPYIPVINLSKKNSQLKKK